MVDQKVVDPNANLEIPVDSGEVLTPEFDYDAEFNAQIKKREAEKAGDAAPVTTPEPAGNPEPVIDAAPVEPVATPDDDILSAVPEDKREAVRARLANAAAAEERAKKLDLDNRSLSGRMSAYQRRYEEAAGKRPVEVVQAAKAEQSAEWTQFVDDYPDIAKAIEARYAQSAPTASPDIQSVVEYVENEKRNRFLQDAWEAVEAVHPGWRDLGMTKDFQDWKESTSTYKKLAASDDVSDAIALFDIYKHSHPATAAKAPDPASVAAATQLAARREAQAEGARSTTSRASAPNQNVDLSDPDQLFAFYAQKSNNRLKSRHF
jgi:hypothetical protein